MNLIETHDWQFTKNNEPRGYIDPSGLKELWFHLGTACNLECPFCLEGSRPGDNRLQAMKQADVEPYIKEALDLGVERFAFTGGEPFVIKDTTKILAAASEHRPCLVLTNGTRPLLQRLHQLDALSNSINPIHFRISIDYPNEEQHDQGRGKGTFLEALRSIRELTNLGFEVSVARQMTEDENTSQIEQIYADLFNSEGIDARIHLVAFPDFAPPFQSREHPEISESCMTTYHNEDSRKKFMCAYTKMLVKINNKIRVYACTLVDDSPKYDLGATLKESMGKRVILKHHRCFSCFSFGASCSG